MTLPPQDLPDLDQSRVLVGDLVQEISGHLVPLLMDVPLRMISRMARILSTFAMGSATYETRACSISLTRSLLSLAPLMIANAFAMRSRSEVALGPPTKAMIAFSWASSPMWV